MDHQYLMKLLPSFLFPLGDRDVVEFMSTGFSMGGEFTPKPLTNTRPRNMATTS